MKIIHYFSAALFVLAFMAFVSASSSVAEDISADSIVGKWKEPDDDAVVQIENKGTYYEGAVVEAPSHPEGVSTVIFKNLVYDATDGVWKGQVYSIEKKKDYNVEIKMSDPASFTMKAKAGILSKTIVWTRVE
jgi:uncharacterized protein (DUF2147 family)